MSLKYNIKPQAIKSLSYKSSNKNNPDNFLSQHAQIYKMAKQRIDKEAENYDEF